MICLLLLMASNVALASSFGLTVGSVDFFMLQAKALENLYQSTKGVV